jgi:DUF4097 and DUF4098 domain-containing protein YvlB
MVGRLSVTGVLFHALIAGSCLSASVIGTPKAEFHQTYSLNPNGRVVIHNLYGDVRITAWDRDEVLVQAIKKSSDPKQLEDAKIVVDSSCGLVSIHTQYAGADAEHPASVEYRIMVPRTANLENVKLVNGGLSITGLEGSIKASSVNGSIKADRLGGQVDLSTINGHLEAGFSRVSRLNSISLSSVNGPIRLLLPSGSDAQLVAHNLSGGIESDFGRVLRASGGHRLRTTLNRGGTQIRVNNVNGGISIRSSWNHRIAS